MSSLAGTKKFYALTFAYPFSNAKEIMNMEEHNSKTRQYESVLKGNDFKENIHTYALKKKGLNFLDI